MGNTLLVDRRPTSSPYGEIKQIFRRMSVFLDDSTDLLSPQAILTIAAHFAVARSVCRLSVYHNRALCMNRKDFEVA